MNIYTVQRACTWSGVIGVMLFYSGFVFSGFIPPPSPSLTQSEVAVRYQQSADGIRFGMLMMMISSMFIMPLIGVISAQIKRMQSVSPALTYAQISAGTAGTILFLVPAVLFIVTAYRPDRPPELTYLMNDICWILAVLPWPPAFMQNVVIGVAVLSDRGQRPVFPRWVAYFNFWVAIGFLPATFLPFFKTGPFAWNGIISFWLAGGFFTTWFIVMTVMLLKAIRQQEAQESSPA